MTQSALDRYSAELDAIRGQGLFKSERVITSPQSAKSSWPTPAGC